MPPDGEGQPQKRPRPIISCLRCRGKKLKCDRVAPCENCKKAGCPSDCAFQHAPEGATKRPRTDDASDQRLASEDGRVGIIEGLQNRLKRLEDILAMGPQPHLPQIPQSTSPAAPYPGVLVVKGARTLYHGQTNRVSLLHQYTDAKTFINHECNMSSPIFRLAKEIQFLQSKSKTPKSPESIIDSRSPELQQLRDRLPPFDVCDPLVSLYTTNFEKTFRILHLATFEREFARFKQGEMQGDASAGFLARLTATLVVSMSLVDEQFRLDYPTVHGYLQNDALDLVRSWLRKLGRKQRTEISTLQTEALVILARQLRRDSPGDLWQATGELVRSAMVIGLHLDVKTHKEISAFQKEMRRRVWTTIAEMDLQTSIASGMPVTMPDMEFGPLTPANLDDADFDESMNYIPPSRPTSEYTDTLAQALLAGSLRTRIKAMLVVQSGSCNLPQAVELARELDHHLHRLGVYDPPTRPGKGTALVFSSVLVDLYIRRPLICLHSHISNCHPQHSLRNGTLDLCLVILSHQDHFDPTVTTLDVPSFWETFQIFCKNDILRAALHVCEHINHPETSPPTHHTKASLVRAVDNALQGLIRSFGQPGSSFKDVLLLSVELHLVRADGIEGEKKESVHRGVLEALTSCRQRLISSSAEQQGSLAQILQTPQPFNTNQADTPVSLSHFPDLGDPTLFGAEFDDFMPFDDDAIGAFFADF
ncbi:hypothetical protein BJY01DRAFT_260708 [Aspergillus pseudoustus]|uniref:Zn(2)-C6 fungal-type domain-containing protein n=1 Tax=Aspergillus pseudoustus TaxID=1810923 RepID=A0ABR4ITA5_9EURO